MTQRRQRRSPASSAGTLIAFPIFVALLLLLSPACGDDTAAWPGNSRFISALTGETCTPNIATFMPNDDSNGNVSPTGIPGDNMDDLRSGKVDCLGDGNSGQGDDKKHNCAFPQPGCDDAGCCEVPPSIDDSEPPAANDPDPPAANDPDPPAANDPDPPAADDSQPPDCSDLDDFCGEGFFNESTGACDYLEWPECETAA